MTKSSIASIPFSVIAMLSVFSSGCHWHHHHDGQPPVVAPPPGNLDSVVVLVVERENGPTIPQQGPAADRRLFGSRNIHVGNSNPLEISIENPSHDKVVSLGMPSLIGANASEFTIESPTMKTELAPKDSTSFYIAFAPQTLGSKTATVQFQQGIAGQSSSPFSFSIVGTGTDATVYVSPAGDNNTNDGLSSTHPFRTIQAAIDAVQSNKNGLYPNIDTLFIANGVYSEQLLLNTSLTLAGESKENTIIQAPAVIADNPAGSNDKDLVVIQGGLTTQAEISHLTIKGPGPASCGSILSGARVRGNATAYIHDSQFLSIREGGVSGCQNGIGILVGYRGSDTTALQNASETATLWHNLITDYQKDGIVVNGSDVYALILQNQVTGAGPHPQIAQNGIEMGYGARGRIEGNFISQNMCNLPGVCGVNFDKSDQDVAIGLYIFKYGQLPIQIIGNVISDNDFGIATLAGSAGSRFVSVQNNLISENRYIQVLAMQGSTSLFDNTLLGGKWGLVASTNQDIAANSTVYGKGNQITHNEIGVEVLAGASTPANLFVEVDLLGNNFVKNTNWGVKNDLTTQSMVTADDNFWGSSNGPGGIGPGSGDKISGQVEFAPFATTPFPAPTFP